MNNLLFTVAFQGRRLLLVDSMESFPLRSVFTKIDTSQQTPSTNRGPNTTDCSCSPKRSIKTRARNVLWTCYQLQKKNWKRNQRMDLEKKRTDWGRKTAVTTASPTFVCHKPHITSKMWLCDVISLFIKFHSGPNRSVAPAILSSGSLTFRIQHRCANRRQK